MPIRFFLTFSVSYRLDSDSTWPYAFIEDIKTNQIIAPSKFAKWRKVNEHFEDDELLELALRKKKDLIGVISHCDANSKRDELIGYMQNFTKFDVYGKCGKFE